MLMANGDWGFRFLGLPVTVELLTANCDAGVTSSKMPGIERCLPTDAVSSEAQVVSEFT